jgi:two-component system phosphate regulon sensor histidine kinase PhoR
MAHDDFVREHNEVPVRNLEFGLVKHSDHVRMAIIFALAVLYFANLDRWGGILAGMALCFAGLMTVWSYFFLRWDKLLVNERLPLAVILTALLDVAWVTTFLYGTGGFASPFWSLYFVVIIFAAVFFCDEPGALPLVTLLMCALLALMAATTPDRNLLVLWQLVGRLALVIVVAWLAHGLAAVIERERRANQEIVSHLVEGVAMVSAGQVIILANPQFGKLTGLSSDELFGKGVEKLIHVGPTALLEEAFADVRARPLEHKSRRVALKGRHITDLRISTVPYGLAGEPPLGWLVILQDVTDLQTMTRLRERSLGLLTQDLQQPLTSMQSVAQFLGEMAGDLTESERQGALQVIERETDRLSRLTGELMEAAEVEGSAFTLDLAPVRLDEIAVQVLRTYLVEAEQKQVRLVNSLPSELAPLIGDPARIRQIVSNLVDNAVKFTPSGGRVELGVELQPGWVHLWVRDTGCGIPDERHETIFSRLSAADAEDDANESTPHQHSYRGVGLGLYVSRLLARKHGGDLCVESSPGQGSTLTLALPLPSPAESASAEPHLSSVPVQAETAASSQPLAQRV